MRCTFCEGSGRFTRIWMLIFITTVIGGCAGASRVELRPALTESAVVAPSSGTLVARVVNAGSAPLPFNYLTIIPSNFHESEEVNAIRLESLGGMVGDSTVFISSVPEGNYTVSSLRGFYSTGDRWYSRWVEADIELGTFKVEPGKTTDLGVLVYYPKPQGDKMLETLLRSPGSSNSELIAGFAPFAVYQADQALRWNEEGSSDERFATYTSTVRNPVVYNKRFVAPDNSVYFVGKLGFILRRLPNGEWQEDAVETDADILAIDVNRSGDIAVGGELGVLFYKTQGADSWQKIVLDRHQTVQEITLTESGGMDVVLWDRSKIIVQRIANLEQPDERQSMARYESEFGWRDASGAVLFPKLVRNRPVSISTLYAKKINEKNYLFLSDTLGRAELYNPIEPTARKHAFRYNPDTWEITPFSHFGDGVDRIMDAGYVRLGIKTATYWTWDGKDDYFRYDASAKKWIEIRTQTKICTDSIRPEDDCEYIMGEVVPSYRDFEFLSIPVFFSNTEAVAFVKYVSNSDDPQVAIVATENGGKRWYEIASEFPGKYCSNTIPEVKSTLLISCNGISSDFYESQDRGLSWKHVRQSENF